MSLCDNCMNFPCTDEMSVMLKSCPAFSPIPKPQTNGDSIRSMMDEELASLLSPVCVHGLVTEQGECDKADKTYCVDCWMEWLRAGVEE